MKDLHRSWGAKVKDRRKAFGWTQEQLAERSGLAQSTISKIEKGDMCPSDPQKWVLAGVLRERMDALFPYPGIVPPAPNPKAA